MHLILDYAAVINVCLQMDKQMSNGNTDAVRAS